MYKLYVGSYTDYIYVIDFESDSEIISLVDKVHGGKNPSFLAKNIHHIYAACELPDKAGVASFVVQNDGLLICDGYMEADGSASCHVSISADRKRLYVSDYMSGGFWAVGLHKNGKITEILSHKTFIGKGIDSIRQDKQHSHSVSISPDGRFAIGADLGLDKLFVFDGKADTLEAISEISVPAGYGPRHSIFSQDSCFLYCICELANRILVYSTDTSNFSLIGDYALLDHNAVPSLSAGITLTADGKYLLASIRGVDLIVCFRRSQNGLLHRIGYCNSGGKEPRDFSISSDEKYIFVANQGSNSLSVLRIISFEPFSVREITHLEIPAVSAVIL